MQIFIRNVIHGKTMIFNFSPSDTIEYVKKKIQEKHKIPWNTIILNFCTKQLENDKTLSDYNISQYSTLQLNMKLSNNELSIKENNFIKKETSEKDASISSNINNKEISIIIKLKIEKNIPLKIKNINNIEEIKKMIHIKENISPNKQILIYNNNELDEKKTFFRIFLNIMI